ncbi:hypothetical protein GGQ84_001845 [Desulfitispora alkaliphila]|uniref:hypothetical protein n=1 Tax=Desulfitispora alkaliphila TaxID=622674 RepID=UPI003D1FD233
MFSEIRVSYIVLITVVTVGVLFGGYSIFNKYYLEQPMIEQIRAQDGVKSAQLEQETITIELDGGLELIDIHGEILDVAGDEYAIVYKENPSQEMEQLFKESSFTIYEGINKNNYVVMKERLDSLYGDAGVEGNLAIDQSFLYIQLYKNGNSINRVIAIDEGSDLID